MQASVTHPGCPLTAGAHLDAHLGPDADAANVSRGRCRDVSCLPGAVRMDSIFTGYRAEPCEGGCTVSCVVHADPKFEQEALDISFLSRSLQSLL